jgi:hypothetical protein
MIKCRQSGAIEGSHYVATFFSCIVKIGVDMGTFYWELNTK